MHNLAQAASRSVKRYSSPLRYPGGKASFTPLITSILKKNNLLGCSYYEPFAGGAGAALKLLSMGLVSSIHLNDADYRIFALWRAIFSKNKSFADAIRNAELTVAEWRKQFEVCKNAKAHSWFDVAYATFFMNRCNRSGVILGARPIGGLDQKGTYLIDARFNREILAKRIEALSTLKNSVHLYNLDALVFLKRFLPAGPARKQLFVYLDPPYYKNGQRLYLNYYLDVDHKQLAVYMKRQACMHWLMSYDNTKEINALYGDFVKKRIDVSYSMQLPRRDKELLITSRAVKNNL